VGGVDVEFDPEALYLPPAVELVAGDQVVRGWGWDAGLFDEGTELALELGAENG
jgi:hypothetical protein